MTASGGTGGRAIGSEGGGGQSVTLEVGHLVVRWRAATLVVIIPRVLPH